MSDVKYNEECLGKYISINQFVPALVSFIYVTILIHHMTRSLLPGLRGNNIAYQRGSSIGNVSLELKRLVNKGLYVSSSVLTLVKWLYPSLHADNSFTIAPVVKSKCDGLPSRVK